MTSSLRRPSTVAPWSEALRRTPQLGSRVRARDPDGILSGIGPPNVQRDSGRGRARLPSMAVAVALLLSTASRKCFATREYLNALLQQDAPACCLSNGGGPPSFSSCIRRTVSTPAIGLVGDAKASPTPHPISYHRYVRVWINSEALY